jgi:hypothetical protein
MYYKANYPQPSNITYCLQLHPNFMYCGNTDMEKCTRQKLSCPTTNVRCFLFIYSADCTMFPHLPAPFNNYTGCPTTYHTRHFFNNSNTNDIIATKFEQEYVRCVRNKEECVCSAPNCCVTLHWSASQPVSCLTRLSADLSEGAYTIRFLVVSVSVMCEYTQDSWNIFISGKINKEMSGSIASGTHPV